MQNNRSVIVNPKDYGDALFMDKGSLYFRKRVYYQDFSVAATTSNLDERAAAISDPWKNFPAGIEIEGAGLYLVTSFAGVTAPTVSIGTTGSAAAYLTASAVDASAPLGYKGVTLVPFTFLAGTGAPAKATVRVQLLTGGGNASALTAGKLDIFLKLRAVSIRTS